MSELKSALTGSDNLGMDKGDKMKRTFQIIKTIDGYVLSARTENGARCQCFDHFPINAINILKNIGYTEFGKGY